MEFRSIFAQFLIVAFVFSVPTIGPKRQNRHELKIARKMNSHIVQSINEGIYPRPWELRWRKVNVSETDEKGFIITSCFRDLSELAHKSVSNKKFRIRMQTELEQEQKTCQIRFPTGVRLRYRFRFSNPNTHVFFTYGNSKERMAVSSRKLSPSEWPGIPDNIWKGIVHIPCNFSLLIFNPFVAGEVFEFVILDGVEHVDKCSAGWGHKLIKNEKIK